MGLQAKNFLNMFKETDKCLASFASKGKVWHYFQIYLLKMAELVDEGLDSNDEEVDAACDIVLGCALKIKRERRGRKKGLWMKDWLK